MPGRNDVCQCGSGKKYKKCCINKSGDDEIKEWKSNSIESFKENIFNNEQQKHIQDAFFGVLKFIKDTDWKGSCHASSAVLYILLREYRFCPDLIIGEVYSEELKKTFDHSWIELDGKIFDAAIYNTLSNLYFKEPVFNSIDLGSNTTSNLKYGVVNAKIGFEAKSALNMNFKDYMDGFPYRNGLWGIVEDISFKIGKPIYMKENKDRYNQTKRIFSNNTLYTR